MSLFIFIIILLLGAIALTRLANSLGVPYPSFLALGGAVIAFIPGVPQIITEPDLALVLFVAPVLLDTAFDTSIRDLKDNWIAITVLVLVAVSLTTAGVAIVLHMLVPTVPWAAAIALGAIVAPPDAAAAAAVLRQIKLPHRILFILEGESLFNDASALLIFGIAVSKVENPDLNLVSTIPLYAVSIVASGITGVALAFLYIRIFRDIRYTPAAIVLQFTSTFAVWIAAEKTGLSPILVIVAYGMTLARRTSSQSSPLARLQSYAVWETVVFLSNILAFSLIGMTLEPLVKKLTFDHIVTNLVVAGAVLATVIIVRVTWVMSFNAAMRYKNRRYGVSLKPNLIAPSKSGGYVIAWAGMRGIVTLAAALSLPVNFPERDLIQFLAFAVVLGTLVIQGFTLAPLVKRLTLPTDKRVEEETAKAQKIALSAALQTLDGENSTVAKALRVELRSALGYQIEEENDKEAVTHQQLRLRSVKAARDAVIALRDNSEIGDDAFHRIEGALDHAELYAKRYG